MTKLLPAIALLALAALPAPPGLAQTANTMSFFVTSAGPGKGADLGGLEGADRHCNTLAQAAGAGNRNWRAYLSAMAQGNRPAMNARDRIGDGPWVNAKGVQIAASRANLHSDQNNLTKETALTEKGTVVGDRPTRHDILTGAMPDGTLANGQTCNNWTSSSEGTAMLGHSDRRGLQDDAPSKSWNSSHPSRGCSQDGLKSTGGDGLFYCFAAR